MSTRTPAVIYNLFPLLAGEIGTWKPHLERAAGMGFNWIFLNPVSLPGLSGSLYSVKDYYRLNPLLTDSASARNPDATLDRMLDEAHGLGLKVMLDLVINHTAIDSPLIKKHPDWFCRDKKGKIKNPGVWEGDKLVKVWGDLAEVDNENSPHREELWNYWWDLTEHYLNLGFDGFRCDAAYKVPHELWELLIGRARENFTGREFFAESLGCTVDKVVELAGSGFDYVFNSSKYWDFLEPWCLDQYEQSRKLAPSVSFPESHDTLRLFEELKGNTAAVRQRYLFEALFSTGLMIPIGFEYGFRKRLHVVDTRPADWEEPNVDLTGFIARVNAFKLGNEIFRDEYPTYGFGLGEGSGKVTGLIKLIGERGPSALLLVNRDPDKPQRAVIPSLELGLPGAGPLTEADPSGAARPGEVPPGTFDQVLPPAGLKVILREA
jgi:starch synthase (maltosyl-transferring)